MCVCEKASERARETEKVFHYKSYICILNQTQKSGHIYDRCLYMLLKTKGIDLGFALDFI